MVDVMAPVFDHLVDERDAPSRSRRAQWWQRDTRRQDDDESDSDKDHDERGHDVDEQQGNPTTFDPLNAFAGLLSVPVSALLGTSASSLPAPTPSSASRTTSLTLSSSSSSSSSTVGLPTVPANSPIANNPQVPAEQTGTTSSLPTSSAKTSPATTSPVTSSVTIMMTTSVSLPTTVSTSSFIDTLFPSSTTVSSTSTTPTSSVTAAFANQPSPSIYLTNTDNGLNTFRDGEHHDSDDDHDPPPPSGGLSPTGEDVLISAGSIGKSVLVCHLINKDRKILTQSPHKQELSFSFPSSAGWAGECTRSQREEGMTGMTAMTCHRTRCSPRYPTSGAPREDGMRWAASDRPRCTNRPTLWT